MVHYTLQLYYVGTQNAHLLKSKTKKNDMTYTFSHITSIDSIGIHI